ncbi:FK506-binding protein 4 [Drosophila elegans]|uniref:FK506-binding protein 4 n=1 Tax=Drosophila elegans TaxID=30023 RepID=UPI0007E800D2|nr:FK506-binding protein 4 [Drosophila elegans]
MLLPELLLLGLVVSLADSYDRSVNYWEAFAPGKLLQRLDALTATDVVDHSQAVKLPEMMQPVVQTQAQAKADEDVDVDVEPSDDDVDVEPSDDDVDVEPSDDDVDVEPSDDDVDVNVEPSDDDVDVEPSGDDVDNLSAETSHEGYSGEDYERNYEQFVQEYFDRAADKDNHDNDNDDDADELEEETQAEASNVKDQRCRRVRRKDGQLCEICRQLKNNEVSETCSYSHDDQPEQYAFGSGTQYKRYRHDPAEEKEREKGRATAKEEQVAPSSLCVRRQRDNSVCYACKDSKGQKIERCYDVEARKAKTRKKKASSSSSSSSSSPFKKRKPRSQQSQQSEQEQRIYKRTISYSYAQGTDRDQDRQGNQLGDQQGDQQEERPPDGTPHRPPVPRQRRRRLVKITRRRGPVPVQ